jgi:glycosyltransferase involved in cell wall biosynthesis
MAGAVHDRGYDVVVGGPVWLSSPDSPLANSPIPVSVRTWPTARWMRRLLRDTRPDVVHAHWMPVAGLACLYGASPLVVSAWGSDVFLASRSQKLAWRAVARQADLFMASSAALVRALHDLGAPAERTVLLNWGVDLTTFSPPMGGREALRRALGLPPGPMILSPRSDADVYNPNIILRAFERLADERDDITLVLLSTAEGYDLGPMRHPDRVFALGRIPHKIMVDYYRAAAVCVSVASSDSSPRSVWEAMACGVPCVLSDIPWVHELISHEEHAVVVPIDEQSVARALRRCIDDGAFADRIAVAARRLVETHRDRERETARLCEIYEKLALDGGRRSRPLTVLGPITGAVGTAEAVIRRALTRGGDYRQRGD